MIVKACKVKGEYNERGKDILLDAMHYFYTKHFKGVEWGNDLMCRSTTRNWVKGTDAVKQMKGILQNDGNVECISAESVWKIQKRGRDDYEINATLHMWDTENLMLYISPYKNKKMGDIDQPSFLWMECDNPLVPSIVYEKGRKRSVNTYRLIRNYL